MHHTVFKIKFTCMIVCRQRSATHKIQDSRGCITCCISRNPYNDQKFVVAAVPKGILVLRWYPPRHIFMMDKVGCTLQHFHRFTYTVRPPLVHALVVLCVIVVKRNFGCVIWCISCLYLHAKDNVLWQKLPGEISTEPRILVLLWTLYHNCSHISQWQHLQSEIFLF